MFCRPFGQERPRNRLVQTTGCRGTAQPALKLLLRRGGGPGDAFHTWQGDTRDLVEAVNAHDLLDQIGRAFDVVAAQRADHVPIGAHSKAEAFEDALLFVLRHLHTAKAGGQAGIEDDHFCRARRRTGADRLAGGAACQFHDQAGQQIKPVVEKFGVHAALEARARIG